MEYRHQNPDWFIIDPSQLKNAKIYLDRKSFIQQLPKFLDIMEVGVAAGDFAEVILEECSPEILYLIDLYNLPEICKTDNPRYTETTNLEFVKERFRDYSQVKIIVGDSKEVLPNLDKYFDFIYLDADHYFDGASLDLNNSASLLKPNGIIGINDYAGFSEKGERYGTIKAVHTFLKHHLDWEVIAFALHNEGYFDIYLKHKQVI